MDNIMMSQRVLFIFSLFVLSTLGRPIWAQTEIPVKWHAYNIDGGGYTNFVIIDRNNPKRVYAGSDVGGIYQSDNFGDLWAPMNKGLVWPTDRLVAAFTIDPSSGRIYLGVGRRGLGGIFVREPDGRDWHLLTRKITFNAHGLGYTAGKRLIVLDSKNPLHIYAASYDQGLFLSKNQGKSWEHIGLKGYQLSSVVLHPAKPNMIFVSAVKGNKEGGLFRSLNQGKEWKSIDKACDDAYDLLMDPYNNEILYAACGKQGVRKSIDGGKTWSSHNKGLIIPMITGQIKYITLAADEDQRNTLYVGSGKRQGKLFKTTNGGNQWINLTSDLSTVDPGRWWKTQEMHWPGGRKFSINSVSVDSVNNKLYIAGRSGLWRSDDGGEHWAVKVKNLGETCCQSIALNKANPHQFFVGCADWGFFQTMDKGQTFTRSLNGIGIWDMASDKDMRRKYKVSRGTTFAIDASKDPPTLFAALAGNRENTGTVFKSIDGGETWQEANYGLPTASVTAIALKPDDPYTVFAALLNKGLYQSRNRGKTWEKVTLDGAKDDQIVSKHWTSIMFHPQDSRKIYFLNKKIGLFRSVDGGKRWDCLTRSLPSASISGMDQYIGSVALDPQDSEVIYLGVRNLGVMKTIDGGKQWKRITSKFMHHGGAMSMDPASKALYVASVPGVGDQDIKGFYPGIYRSSDKGQTWQRITYEGSYKITSLTVYQNQIFISTQGNGIAVGEIQPQ
jgi:photosystem II stability/assembly factor-like uncharacterized protein